LLLQVVEGLAAHRIRMEVVEEEQVDLEQTYLDIH